MPLPRSDANTEQLAEAFTMLALVIDDTGREAVRRLCLNQADNKGLRNLLVCLNDFERINDWRKKNPLEAQRLASEPNKTS